MICMFEAAGKKITTNEEYAQILKKKIKIYILLIIAGIITAGLAFCNEAFGWVGDNPWLNGVYCGIGMGITVAAAIWIIRYRKTLKNENRLREERLKSQDERNRLIASMAVKYSSIAVFIFSYIAMIISGFYSKALFFCFWSVIMIFCVCYLILVKYFSKKI